MRSLLLVLTFCSLSLNAATTLETRVHSLDFGDTQADAVLALLANGQVARINTSEVTLLEKLQHAQTLGQTLKLSLNDKNEITSLKPIFQIQLITKSSVENKMMFQDFIPSVLGSYEQARNLFLEMRKSPVQESQCWQRAHVWSYEWRMKHDLFTSKAWIFFTRKYLRENPDFGWWFHVAPMVHVNMDGVIKERVMDRKHANGPQMIKRWTDTFIRDRSVCRVVDTYSDHANFQDSASCFLQKSSMYFLQPVDLELFEKFATPRSSWVEPELVDAYDKAFLIKSETAAATTGEVK